MMHKYKMTGEHLPLRYDPHFTNEMLDNIRILPFTLRLTLHIHKLNPVIVNRASTIWTITKVVTCSTNSFSAVSPLSMCCFRNNCNSRSPLKLLIHSTTLKEKNKSNDTSKIIRSSYSIPAHLTYMHLSLKMHLVFENKCMHLYSNAKKFKRHDMHSYTNMK